MGDERTFPFFLFEEIGMIRDIDVSAKSLRSVAGRTEIYFMQWS